MALVELQALEGSRELLAELNGLSKGLQQKGLRAALRASAKPLAVSMKSNAPDDPKTGGSRIALGINVAVIKDGASVSTHAGRRSVKLATDAIAMIVGPNKKVKGRSVKGLAILTDGGTKPHMIRVRKASALWFGGKSIGREVMHPGSPAQNWISKSLSSGQGQMETKFFQGLEKWLAKNGR